MVLIALSTSFLASVIAVILGRMQSNTRNDLGAVQASHIKPTPRLGGVAVAFGLLAALLAGDGNQDQCLIPLILCALPVFAVGLLEDIGWRMAPIWRLAGSICSGLLAISTLSMLISRVGFPPFDLILHFNPPALLLTALVLTGVSQAFNLVDGLHGMCGMATLVTAGALALIAQKSGHPLHVQALWIVMGAVGGFLMVNFPRGLLFLGDAGAYVLGFFLASIAVDLLQEQPGLSPWAVVLVFFWPLADMILAVVRRNGKQTSSFAADRMHFHHGVMRSLEILFLSKRNRTLSNPIATLIILPGMAAPAILGVLFWNNNGAAFALVLLTSNLFIVAYRSMIGTAKRRSLNFKGRNTRTRV